MPLQFVPQEPIQIHFAQAPGWQDVFHKVLVALFVEHLRLAILENPLDLLHHRVIADLDAELFGQVEHQDALLHLVVAERVALGPVPGIEAAQQHQILPRVLQLQQRQLAPVDRAKVSVLPPPEIDVRGEKDDEADDDHHDDDHPEPVLMTANCPKHNF